MQDNLNSGTADDPFAAKDTRGSTNRQKANSRTTGVSQKNAKAGTARPASKQARVIELLRRKEGASVTAIMTLTGWQKHSVHGFFAGIVRKKLQLNLLRTGEGDKASYRIASGTSAVLKTRKAAKPAKPRKPAALQILTQADALMPSEIDVQIEAELARLRSMPKAELRKHYQSLFKAEPPKAFGPDLLRRSIAYRIQEQAYGGMDAATRRLLNNLIAQHAKSKDGRVVIPRRIVPGAVLVREWKGQSHRVMVLEGGFAYDGKPYASLSEIARLITGARWNGPRFFGLRANGREVSP